MAEKAFWCFFGFASITVFLAFAGGFLALAQKGGGSNLFGFLLFFLGTSLAFMLGSLLFIRMKEKKRNRGPSNQGGQP